MANLDVAMAKPGCEHPGLAIATGRSRLAFSPPFGAAGVRFPPLLSCQGRRVRAGTFQNESQQKQRENSRWDNLPAQAALALLQLQLEAEPLLFMSQKLCFIFSPQNMRQDIHPAHRVAQRAATSGEQSTKGFKPSWMGQGSPRSLS